MPRGDRTGPLGFGPMTGRAAGYCARYQLPGYMSSIPICGFGGGRGRGRRNWYYATGLTGWQRAVDQPYGPTITKEQELAALKDQAEYLENTVNSIKKRIQELGE